MSNAYSKVIDASKVVVSDVLLDRVSQTYIMDVARITGRTMLTFHGTKGEKLTLRKTSAIRVKLIPVIDVYGTDARPVVR